MQANLGSTACSNHTAVDANATDGPAASRTGKRRFYDVSINTLAAAAGLGQQMEPPCKRTAVDTEHQAAAASNVAAAANAQVPAIISGAAIQRGRWVKAAPHHWHGPVRAAMQQMQATDLQTAVSTQLVYMGGPGSVIETFTNKKNKVTWVVNTQQLSAAQKKQANKQGNALLTLCHERYLLSGLQQQIQKDSSWAFEATAAAAAAAAAGNPQQPKQQQQQQHLLSWGLLSGGTVGGSASELQHSHPDRRVLKVRLYWPEDEGMESEGYQLLASLMLWFTQDWRPHQVATAWQKFREKVAAPADIPKHQPQVAEMSPVGRGPTTAAQRKREQAVTSRRARAK